MRTFNQRLWEAEREPGERGDLARLILLSSRARVLSDHDRLRAHVERHESLETLAALDKAYAEFMQERQ